MSGALSGDPYVWKAGRPGGDDTPQGQLPAQHSPLTAGRAEIFRRCRSRSAQRARATSRTGLRSLRVSPERRGAWGDGG